MRIDAPHLKRACCLRSESSTSFESASTTSLGFSPNSVQDTLAGMHGFIVDLRQSLRAFAREPAFAAVAIVALAIGVGSSTAMFSVIDAALLRPLPYTGPERLIELTCLEGTGQPVPMGAVEFFQLEKLATTVEAIGAFYPHAATVASASGPRQARVANLSASLFATLGIVPVRGRAFEPAEDLAGGVPVAIVSDAFWRHELGADRGVLGRTLEVLQITDNCPIDL